MSQFEHELSEDIELKKPKMYKVMLLNDDYTSMEFVITTLMNIFHKSEEDAYSITMRIHNNGSGLCGVYTHEIAETKVAQVLSSAKKSKFPLRAVMEEE
ncbi:MAG TPA: ATP-dependent Clp protease adaptor ClpS [Sulfurospirillum arcachonense]|nr:ATP-dependent Clp protease adaptor ClpS [Sulfurospirillum arcachonense]HIP44796.1 ATP-dependent Clp protease adaptor ClpS [Sulfurospirillum arcachonense]